MWHWPQTWDDWVWAVLSLEWILWWVPLTPALVIHWQCYNVPPTHTSTLETPDCCYCWRMSSYNLNSFSRLFHTTWQSSKIPDPKFNKQIFLTGHLMLSENIAALLHTTSKYTYIPHLAPATWTWWWVLSWNHDETPSPLYPQYYFLRVRHHDCVIWYLNQLYWL